MEELGSSLEELFLRCGRLFSLKTVLMLGALCLPCIEYVHFRNYVHLQVQPRHFLFGIKDRADMLFLIDY